MVTLFVRALLFWIWSFEALADRFGWRGFTWMGGWLPRVAIHALPPAVLISLLFQRGKRFTVLALAWLPALLIQMLVSSLRNRALDPLRRLEPGNYADRSVVRVNIPMAEGYMPALYITPHDRAQAAVAVLHGSGCDKTYYAWRIADAIVGRGMAALLVDLDGHGENPRLQSLPSILEDPHVAVAWLRERHERVGLVGVSLGGCLAARAAADGLELDALAVLEAPPQLWYTQADIWREAAALAQPFLLDLLGESTAYNLGYTIYDLIKVQGGPRIRYTINTWELITALDLLESLPRITAPLLLLYGGRDAIVKPDQVEQARHAAPPGTPFMLVPAASHLTLILHPDALRITGDWLAEQLYR